VVYRPAELDLRSPLPKPDKGTLPSRPGALRYVGAYRCLPFIAIGHRDQHVGLGLLKYFRLSHRAFFQIAS